MNTPADKATPASQPPRKWRRRFKRAVLAIVACLIVGGSAFLIAARDHIRSLWSLRRIPDTKMYVMDYYGDYNAAGLALHGTDPDDIPGSMIRNFFPGFLVPIGEAVGGHAKGHRAWRKGDHSCSTAVVRNDKGEVLFGRNFDWMNDSCLVLHVHGKKGSSSVTVIDLHYLQLGESQLDNPSLANRSRLLFAPYVPMDGMNDSGLAISCMSVKDSQLPPHDDINPTLVVTAMMRLILDLTKTTDEAVALLRRYNIDFDGVPCHFLIAEASGKSVVVEFVDGRIEIVPSTQNWQVSTNHLLCGTSTAESQSSCVRYKTASDWLARSGQEVDAPEMMRLMSAMSVNNWTMWTGVYNLTTGDFQVAYRRNYDKLYGDRLQMRRPTGHSP